MMRHVKKSGKYYYIVEPYTEDGNRKFKHIRKATEEEYLNYKKATKARTKIIKVSCSYPECSNTIPMTIAQKHAFFTTYPKRYGKLALPYCSKECREKHFNDLQSEKSKIKVK